jgi:hypothetical protein
MATVFVNLPALAGNGAGAAVATHDLAATKTIVNGGNGYIFEPQVNIEIANDAAGVNWVPLYTFSQGNRDVTLNVVARWMRTVVSNYRGGGAPVVDVGADQEDASFATLVAPAGNGNGASVATDALPLFKTVEVTSPFRGTVLIQISEDGNDWSTQMSFTAPGQQSMPFTAAFMRVARAGVPLVDPGLPVVDIAANGGPGGGGGGGGGIYMPPEQWAISTLADDQSDVGLSCQVSTNFDTWIALRNGSIRGLRTRFSSPVTAGQAEVRVTINGVVGTLSVVSTAGLNPSGGVATQVEGVDTYLAGDELGVAVTTDAPFEPDGGTNLEAYIDISNE